MGELNRVHLPVRLEANAATEPVPGPLAVQVMEAAEGDGILHIAVAPRFDVRGLRKAVQDEVPNHLDAGVYLRVDTIAAYPARQRSEPFQEAGVFEMDPGLRYRN